jgi:hypothetical protein
MKCDGQKPECGQCRKSCRVCSGYERDLHFKNLSALDHDSLLARAQPLVSRTAASVVRPKLKEVEDVHEPNDDQLSAIELSSHTVPLIDSGDKVVYEVDQLTALPPSSLVEAPNGLALRDTSIVNMLFSRFMDEYVPLYAPNPHSLLSWLQVILDIPAHYESVDLAVAALSMVRLGRTYHDDILRMRGMNVYVRALRSMQKLLVDDRSLYNEQTLATSMTMSVFEVCTISTWYHERYLLTFKDIGNFRGSNPGMAEPCSRSLSIGSN